MDRCWRIWQLPCIVVRFIYTSANTVLRNQSVIGNLWDAITVCCDFRGMGTIHTRNNLKALYWYWKLSDRSEIWQAPWQHCCRGACQISKRCDDLNYQSRGFKTRSYDKTSYRILKQGPDLTVVNTLIHSRIWQACQQHSRQGARDFFFISGLMEQQLRSRSLHWFRFCLGTWFESKITWANDN